MRLCKRDEFYLDEEDEMRGADSEMSTLPVLEESRTPVGELTLLLLSVGVSGLLPG